MIQTWECPASIEMTHVLVFAFSPQLARWKHGETMWHRFVYKYGKI